MTSLIIRNRLVKLSYFLWFFLFASVVVKAEQVTYRNLSFNVIGQRQVSVNEHQIDFNFGQILVPSKDWQAYALSECLNANCAKFSIAELLEFLLSGDNLPNKLAQEVRIYIRNQIGGDQLYRQIKKILAGISMSYHEQRASILAQICQAQLSRQTACLRIKTYENRLLLANELISAGNTDGVILLLATYESKAELVESASVIAAAISKLSQLIKTEELFSLLSILPHEAITESSIELLQSILQKEVYVKAWSESSDLLSAQKTIFSSNPRLLDSWSEFFRKQVDAASNEKDYDGVSGYLALWLSFIEKFRYQKHENKFELYLRLLNFGKQDLAEPIFADIKGQLSISDRTRIFYARYLKSINYWVVISLGVLVTSLLFWFFILFIKNTLSRKKINDFARNRIDQVAAEDDVQPQKIFSTGNLAVSPKMIRYRECLKKIGIEGPVNIKEIKAAYRQAVKLSHPDVNPGKSEDALTATNFMEITQAYDEALALHREMVDDKERV